MHALVGYVEAGPEVVGLVVGTGGDGSCAAVACVCGDCAVGRSIAIYAKWPPGEMLVAPVTGQPGAA